MLHHLGLSHFTFTKKPHKECSKFFHLGSLYKKHQTERVLESRWGLFCDGHETLGFSKIWQPCTGACSLSWWIAKIDPSCMLRLVGPQIWWVWSWRLEIDVMHSCILAGSVLMSPSTCQRIICTANNCENYIMLGFLFPLHRIPSILRWVSCSTCCLQSKTVSGPWFLVGESQRSAFAHGQGGQGVNVTEENRGFKQHMKLCRSI